MVKFRFFFLTAIRNLRRGGQRIVIALLCIAFGVMSLSAMTNLADTVSTSLLSDPRTSLGGDMSISQSWSDYVDEGHINQIEDLAQDGLIDAYALLAVKNSIALRTPLSGELHFMTEVMGIEPPTFPIVGNFEIGEPKDQTLAMLLQDVGDVVVTRDVADKFGLAIDDALILSDLETGVVIDGKLTGIISDTPNHQGDTLLYNLETAAMFVGTTPITNILVTTSEPEKLESVLENTDWYVLTSQFIAERDAETGSFISLALKGAGVLGLLVGGIGIANTMQVLLTRRNKEVAILKTMGYTQRNMLALFLFESLLLGVIGSVLGIFLGIGIHTWLLNLLSKLSNLLLSTVQVSPFNLISSLFIGTLTTMIFSAFAVVRNSNIRPAVLLRNQAIRANAMGWRKSMIVFVFLLVPFASVTTYIMGSLAGGLGIMAIALIGLLALGLVMLAIIFVFSRMVPKTQFAVPNLVRNNLRRRGKESVSAMIALFIGIATLTLAAVVTETAQREMDEHSFIIEGINLTVIGTQKYEPALQAATKKVNQNPAGIGFVKLVKDVIVAEGEQAGRYQAPVLFGRDEPLDFLIEGTAWEDGANGVYVYGSTIPTGIMMQITLLDGQIISLPVIGHYEINYYSPTINSGFGLLMHNDLLETIATPDSVSYYFDLPESELSGVATTFGQELPEATVINHASYFARYTTQYQNLYVLALSMAGLSILAGILLIANTVSLALLNRRYEIGVLKAVGYAKRQLIASLLWEYGSLAFIATGLGLMGVWAFLKVFALVNDLAGSLLQITPTAFGTAFALGIMIPLVIVFAVIQPPLQTSPIIVLQDRE